MHKSNISCTKKKVCMFLFSRRHIHGFKNLTGTVDRDFHSSYLRDQDLKQKPTNKNFLCPHRQETAFHHILWSLSVEGGNQGIMVWQWGLETAKVIFAQKFVTVKTSRKGRHCCFSYMSWWNKKQWLLLWGKNLTTVSLPARDLISSHQLSVVLSADLMGSDVKSSKFTLKVVGHPFTSHELLPRYLVVGHLVLRGDRCFSISSDDWHQLAFIHYSSEGTWEGPAMLNGEAAHECKTTEAKTMETFSLAKRRTSFYEVWWNFWV